MTTGVGVIGTGFVANMHLGAVRKIPGARRPSRRGLVEQARARQQVGQGERVLEHLHAPS